MPRPSSTALDPQPDEEPALDARRRQLRAAERIRDDVARAAAALGPDGAEGPLLQALRWLEAAAPQAGGRRSIRRSTASGGCWPSSARRRRRSRRCLADLDGDPGELERGRGAALRAPRRSPASTRSRPRRCPALAADLRARLAALDAGEAGHRATRGRARGRRGGLRGRGRAALRGARRAARRASIAPWRAELPPLKLERARFATEVAPGEPGPEGADRVRFTVATNPGAPAGPIDRIASGGELSRFLLALKVCLSARAPGLTLIFDEIDRGVGGATADAVGRRLQALGQGAQVLVVTHSPQVAARGAHHWQVGKTAAPGRDPHRDRRPRRRRARRGDRPHARRRHRHRRGPRRRPGAARRLIVMRSPVDLLARLGWRPSLWNGKKNPGWNGGWNPACHFFTGCYREAITRCARSRGRCLVGPCDIGKGWACRLSSVQSGAQAARSQRAVSGSTSGARRLGDTGVVGVEPGALGGLEQGRRRSAGGRSGASVSISKPSIVAVAARRAPRGGRTTARFSMRMPKAPSR